MGFGTLFDKTLKDYKTNFKAIFMLVLIFIGIILLVSLFNSIFWLLTDDNVRELTLNPMQSEQLKFPILYWVVIIAIGLITFLLSNFIYAGITGASLTKNKFSYEDLKKIGSSFFVKYLLFSIVLVIFLFGLTLLLIIPGIIFAIYWIFGIYVMYDEKKGILQSLKRSKEIVKGNWWKVFGYLVLFIIISYVITLIISVISLPTIIISFINIISGNPISIEIGILNLILSSITNFIVTLIITPFSILFFKNFYLEMKNEKKGKAPLSKK